jgi:hypothetical protein
MGRKHERDRRLDLDLKIEKNVNYQRQFLWPKCPTASPDFFCPDMITFQRHPIREFQDMLCNDEFGPKYVALFHHKLILQVAGVKFSVLWVFSKLFRA